MINVLYIAVGEGGSDQALITLIKELKSKIRPYVTLGKLASQSTINKLKSENIPYSILNYDFFWYPSKKNLWNYITRPIYAFKLKNKKKFFTKQIIELSKQYKIDIIHTNYCSSITKDSTYMAPKRVSIFRFWTFTRLLTSIFKKTTTQIRQFQYSNNKRYI